MTCVVVVIIIIVLGVAWFLIKAIGTGGGYP